MVSRTTYLRRWGEKKVQFRKVKKDRGPRKKKAIFGDLSLYYINRERWWDGICKRTEKHLIPPLPFSSFFIVIVWRVGLSLGGLLPRDGLLLVYQVSTFFLMRETRKEMDIPMAAMMVTIASFPSLKAFSISLPRSVSGILTSSLEFPSPSIKLRKPCFVSRLYLIPALDATHILNVDELVFGSGNVGDIHVVGL
jgi:hypothetical protein